MSFLTAVNQPVPQLWQMEAEAEANAANLEVDLVLLDKIDDHGYEAEQLTFAEELTMEAPFTPTVEDKSKLKQYALSPVPAILKSEMNAYIRHRCAVFASKRSSAAVVSETAEHGLWLKVNWEGCPRSGHLWMLRDAAHIGGSAQLERAAEPMSAAALAASVEPSTAIPTSALFRAGASLTPSPVMPTMLPCR